MRTLQTTEERAPLPALLTRSTPKGLTGKFTLLTGETDWFFFVTLL